MSPSYKYTVRRIDFYEIIEHMYPDARYCELFARRERHGWTSWGNELEVACFDSDTQEIKKRVQTLIKRDKELEQEAESIKASF